jgi:hypothetical protein
MTLGKYGPRVIGDEAFESEKAVVTKAADIYGPRVVDDHVEPKVAARTIQPPPDGTLSGGGDGNTGLKAEGNAAAGADDYLSVRELDDALDANPALVDVFLEQEEQREDPRITAVKRIEKAELVRPGGARDHVLVRIKALGDRVASQNTDL